MSAFVKNPSFDQTLRSALAVAVMDAAAVVVDEAKARLNRGGEPVSLPGESPVSQTGELAGSLQTFGPVENHAAISASAGTNLYRLIWLEKGTSSVQPRPLLMPSVESSKGRILDTFDGALTGGLG